MSDVPKIVVALRKKIMGFIEETYESIGEEAIEAAREEESKGERQEIVGNLWSDNIYAAIETEFEDEIEEIAEDEEINEKFGEEDDLIDALEKAYDLTCEQYFYYEFLPSKLDKGFIESLDIAPRESHRIFN